MCDVHLVFPYTQRDRQDKCEPPFVLPLSSGMCSKTVTCRPRPLCFNNNSLDPPKRGGGPDMRRCDSSGAADTMAGFSFDCLAGCTPLQQIVMFAQRNMFNHTRPPSVPCIVSHVESKKNKYVPCYGYPRFYASTCPRIRACVCM